MCWMSQEMRQTNIDKFVGFLRFAQKQTTLCTRYLYHENQTVERLPPYLGDFCKIGRTKR